MLHREPTSRDFSVRDRTIVREVQALLSPLVGRELTRFVDPSPSDLPPRVRQVLACLLEGDGDKQVAGRLGLSIHTVNEYTKRIFRHFGVQSRAQLMARWVRRGWSTPPKWLDRN
jgi:DNA-binding NarL/FixJ family response regulator